MGQSLIAAFLPVLGGLGFFPQHHGRAVGKEMHWCER